RDRDARAREAAPRRPSGCRVGGTIPARDVRPRRRRPGCADPRLQAARRALARGDCAAGARLVIRTTVWQRLEPQSRTVEYDRALQAQVHDPLWLLGRQWQFGELEGEDAGSPVHARAETSSAPFARFRAAGAATAQPYDPGQLPLEVLAEAEPAGPPTLRTRADAGRR